MTVYLNDGATFYEINTTVDEWEYEDGKNVDGWDWEKHSKKVKHEAGD